MQAQVIQKENISDLNFMKNEILVCPEMKSERFRLLKQGEVLGNNYKHKLKILFHSAEGKWIVMTAIWFVTEAHIQLKGGVIIPVRAVEDVILNSI